VPGVLAGHKCSGVSIPSLQSSKKLKSYVESVYPPKQKAMEGDVEARMVPLDDRKRWDFAVSNFLLYAPSNKVDRERLLHEAVGDVSIAAFSSMPPLQRMAIIDKVWDTIVEWVIPTQTAQEMLDPDRGNAVHNSSSSDVDHAFRTFGIGFRCEKDVDKERILRDGFDPLYALPAIAARLGHEVGGTVMQTKTALGQLGLWKENKDAIGQTGICVSRGAMGATKFPEAGYQGEAYLFAVKPSGRGYDTERYQADKGSTAVWKPGEKLFPKVPKADVLAHMKVTKMGTDQYTTGWKIKADLSTLTVISGSQQERAYIDSEFRKLATPGGRAFLFVKTSEYDFHQEM
jgi:hypothetical protein